MTNLIKYHSFGNHKIRTVVDEFGNLWFVAKDVAETLGYSSTNMTMLFRSVPSEWKGSKRIATLGGAQGMLCISEQGLYFFLGRSDKSESLPFQKWIAGDVVPSIRKTGSYGTANAIPSPSVQTFRIDGHTITLPSDTPFRLTFGDVAVDIGLFPKCDKTSDGIRLDYLTGATASRGMFKEYKKQTMPEVGFTVHRQHAPHRSSEGNGKYLRPPASLRRRDQQLAAQRIINYLTANPGRSFTSMEVIEGANISPNSDYCCRRSAFYRIANALMDRGVLERSGGLIRMAESALPPEAGGPVTVECNGVEQEIV